MAECLYCKHAHPVKDNHGEYYSVCSCAESDFFLHPISIVWDGCEFGETEEED